MQPVILGVLHQICEQSSDDLQSFGVVSDTTIKLLKGTRKPNCSRVGGKFAAEERRIVSIYWNIAEIYWNIAEKNLKGEVAGWVKGNVIYIMFIGGADCDDVIAITPAPCVTRHVNLETMRYLLVRSGRRLTEPDKYDHTW